MNSGLTVRPIAGQHPTDVARILPASVDHAVATELAPSRSVTALNSSSDMRHDPAQQGQNNSLSREVVIDSALREVIYRVVDVSTRRVVRQVPEEALLRLRAYTRAIEKGNSPAQAFAHTNRKI